MKEKKFSVLIAEDELPMLHGLRDTFTGAGFKVLLARDGEEAVHMYEKHTPDVILLDIIMPRMDGLAALKKIREHKQGRTVPIVLLTNLNPDDRIMKVLVEHQPSYYLVKSKFTMSEVLAQVQEALTMTQP